MTQTTIEQRLARASEAIAWPDPGNLADEVEARLMTSAAPTETQSPRIQRVVAVAAAVAAVAAALMLWAPARQAAADLLGVVGIRIETTAAVEGEGFNLELGDEIDSSGVIEQFGFAALEVDALGPPDRMYAASLPVARLSQVWKSTDEFPEINGTGVGVLLTQFAATPESGGFVKALAATTTVEFVEVAGREAFWIEGGPHDLSYVDAEGVVVPDSTRLAANVLIWEFEGITYRLESNLSSFETIAIAESGFGD